MSNLDDDHCAINVFIHTKNHGRIHANSHGRNGEDACDQMNVKTIGDMKHIQLVFGRNEVVVCLEGTIEVVGCCEGTIARPQGWFSIPVGDSSEHHQQMLRFQRKALHFITSALQSLIYTLLPASLLRVPSHSMLDMSSAYLNGKAWLFLPSGFKKSWLYS